MRRSIVVTLLSCTALALTGCSDRAPTEQAAVEPQLQEAEVMALTSSNPSILDLRMQSDELLNEPAQTLARFALAKVQLDINQNRPTLYASSLVFAAIPLVERRLNRIPEHKIGKLIELLCTLQKLIGPKLPPTSRLNAIPWCQVEPEELGNEAEFQIISNANGGTVATNTEQLSLTIAANTLRDAAGNPVTSALFTVLPVERRDPTVEAAHPCPQPFDPSYASRDCYPEFYEIRSQPAVQFVNTPALLQVCQLDPHSASPDAPSETVLARLQLFARAAAGAVAILPKFVEGEESPPQVNTLACLNDEDLHDVAIGPVDFSREGVHNAWLSVARLGSRALKALGPKTLYASNTPTHGRVDRELIDFAGTIVGAIDLGAEDPEPSNTLINGDFEQELTTGWTTVTQAGGSAARFLTGDNHTLLLSGGTGPNDDGCEYLGTSNFVATDQIFTMTRNQLVEVDFRIPTAGIDESESTCGNFDRVEIDFEILEETGFAMRAAGFLVVDYTPEGGRTGFLSVHDFTTEPNTVTSSAWNVNEGSPASAGALSVFQITRAGWARASFEVSSSRFPWLTSNLRFRVILRNEDHVTGRQFTLEADDVAVRPIVVIP